MTTHPADPGKDRGDGRSDGRVQHPAEDHDDELTVLLGPGTGHLMPPPGTFERVRRTAARRRSLRAAAAAGIGLAFAAAVALPLTLTLNGPAAPPDPVPPAAPPAAGTSLPGRTAPSAPAPAPSRSAGPTAIPQRPTGLPRRRPSTPSGRLRDSLDPTPTATARRAGDGRLASPPAVTGSTRTTSPTSPTKPEVTP
ncbi:hypothetical protein [Streptantibioticus silvisoli]|uniref:Uncharacterized protein n=1 Tax=Streptantibioticus silvisoli TaxID=2705255 RepID=A0ABT6VX63_9ACTN|nr:hypothetical protein [Streptantibioticus silvisoli]MDI5962028.1 hypothetical protein [Streptantibioticus silvisoli]